LIEFTKAHACGNDFLIVIEESVAGYDKAELAQRLCDRNTGIGADGVEFFAWTGDFSGRIRLYNADGSVAEISGNGTRCVAAWMADELESQAGDELAIETDAGVRICTIDEFRDSDNGGPTTLITADMDVPEFEERTVELSDGSKIEGVYVSMGNPHFVVWLDTSERQDYQRANTGDISQAALSSLDFSLGELSWEEVGQEICFHPDFPEQTNVIFVRILGSSSGAVDQIAIRIFERGVGPTTSSGTGTSASATAMIGLYGGVSPMEVVAPGGAQTVEWAGPGEHLYLTGPATLIASGEAW
jgi:diaminopimelate epimerase